MQNIIELTESDFDTVLASTRFLLLDFWAQTCAPCRVFSEVILNVAADYPEFIFAKVNIETETALAAEFEITSIPFLILIRDQVAVYAESGSLNNHQLRDLLDKARQLDQPQLGESS